MFFSFIGYRQSVLCDVILEAEGVEIPAHRIVLASCSQYFSAMFTSELSESRAEKIILQEVDGRALALLVDFVYTSEVQVTEENVQVGLIVLHSFHVFPLYSILISIGPSLRRKCPGRFNGMFIDFE